MRFVLPALVLLTLSAQALAQSTPVETARACLAAPAPACLADLAIEAGRDEPEGWAISAAFESLIKNDPSPAGRENWMQRYASWASNSPVDGLKERLASVRAEFYSARGEFDLAYKELGLDKAVPDAFADPSPLILDEARVGHVAEALKRIETLIPADSRDALALQLVEIAGQKAPSTLDEIASTIKAPGEKLYALAYIAGFKGDESFFTGPLAEALKAKKPPFDMPDSATREAGNQFLTGALSANNLPAFEAGLKKRPRFSTSDDSDNAARLLTLILKDNRLAWVKPLLGAFAFPKDEELELNDLAGPLRAIATPDLLALVKESATNATVAAPVTDSAVEALASRGDTVLARQLFVDGGRLKVLAQGPYGEGRESTVFETLARALLARGPQAEFEALASSAPSGGAKAYIARITGLKQKLGALDAMKDEPSEEDWGILMELALASGDKAAIAATANRIREPGLRSAAFVQAVNALWEKGER